MQWLLGQLKVVQLRCDHLAARAPSDATFTYRLSVTAVSLRHGCLGHYATAKEQTDCGGPRAMERRSAWTTKFQTLHTLGSTVKRARHMQFELKCVGVMPSG
jgi:hypothetical protein